MIFVLLLLSATDTIDFYIDPPVYRSTIEVKDTIAQITRTEDIFYVEFNYEIPYQELYYETIDSKIMARATIIFKMSDLDRADSLVDTLYRQFTIPSFAEAAKQQMSFLGQFGLHIPTGRFEYTVEVSSGNKIGIIKKQLDIVRGNYKISDILLASDIVSDTTTGDYLKKGNLKVVPRPSRFFNEYYNNLYVYYEIYDIKPDSNSLEITYRIEDKDNKTIRKISRQIAKKFKSQAINFGLNIRGFDPGEYIFSVEVKDPSTQIVAKKVVPFELKRVFQKEVSYEGMPYYEEIEYFLAPKDYKYFQKLPKEGKATYLKKFWESHNYYDIAERFEYADKNYRQGYKPGNKTDRGRIYVKFGPPDEIERSTIEYYESRPYEYWQYFSDQQFLFLDLQGTNEYVLVWTNARGEQSRPTLYKYIPPDKRGFIE